MNATTAKLILAAHAAAIRDAFNARDAIETCGAEWLALGKAIHALCAARDAEITSLAAMVWADGECVKELTLYGRLLRRHTDPCSPTYADLR